MTPKPSSFTSDRTSASLVSKSTMKPYPLTTMASTWQKYFATYRFQRSKKKFLHGFHSGARLPKHRQWVPTRGHPRVGNDSSDKEENSVHFNRNYGHGPDVAKIYIYPSTAPKPIAIVYDDSSDKEYDMMSTLCPPLEVMDAGKTEHQTARAEK